MGLFGKTEVNDDLTTEMVDEIRRLSREVAKLTGEKEAITELRRLEEERVRLTNEVENLKISKARKEEENARKLREVEHATGLLRKQTEWEAKKAAEEATLKVREENLSADRTRFEEQMDFHREQIAGEISRFEGLLKEVLMRLPTVSVDKSISIEQIEETPAATRKRS